MGENSGGMSSRQVELAGNDSCSEGRCLPLWGLTILSNPCSLYVHRHWPWQA